MRDLVRCCYDLTVNQRLDILSSQLLLNAGASFACYTTRHLGSDYPLIAQELGVSVSRLHWLKQVHSTQVYEVDESVGCVEREGDALVTQRPDFIIGVRVADCLPLLVYDPVSKTKAAIHAGWRGLVGGVIENTFLLLKQNGVLAENCRVALGPCICEKCFEVGLEVKAEFEKKFGANLAFIQPGKADRSYISLRQAALLVLKQLGLSEAHIEVLPDCTSCQNDLWPSFRKGDKVLRTFAFVG